MRRIASFVAILILLSTAAPLLACVTGNEMNQEESACCRLMHGKCRNMAKMGCCRTEVRADEHPQLATSAPATDFSFVVICWFAPVLAEVQPVHLALLQTPDEHSPPGLVTAEITVLRI
jgi:hypothetical protein